MNELNDDNINRDWSEAKQSYPIGSCINGKVVRREDYGVFVDFGSQFLGLLEITCIPFSKDRVGIDDLPSEGDVLDLKVIGFHERNRQIRLSAKYQR